MDLEEELKKLIDKKSKECPDWATLYSTSYIAQLNAHINGNCRLSMHEIKAKIDYLAGYFTITLDHPVSDLEFLRARLCKTDRFENIDELLYIKNTTDVFPEAGRLNQQGQSIFYASITVKKNDHALRVVLSEIGAKELDHIDVIRSRQKEKSELRLRMIGIWDYVRRNERPYYLSEDVFEYYTVARNYMEDKFNPKLLSAYDLTDRFFADILSRQGSADLYPVTSLLSEVFFNSSHIDGVLYSSVQAKGEPLVALKPEAVDSSLVHELVSHVMVEKCLGYEFYEYKTISKTSNIDGAGKFHWLDTYNESAQFNKL